MKRQKLVQRRWNSTGRLEAYLPAHLRARRVHQATQGLTPNHCQFESPNISERSTLVLSKIHPINAFTFLSPWVSSSVSKVITGVSLYFRCLTCESKWKPLDEWTPRYNPISEIISQEDTLPKASKSIPTISGGELRVWINLTIRSSNSSWFGSS